MNDQQMSNTRREPDSDTVQRLGSGKPVEDSLSIDTWLSTFAEASSRRKRFAGKRKIVGWVAGLSIPAGVVGGIATQEPVVMLLALAGFILFGLWALMGRFLPKEMDGFIPPLLTLLREEVHPDSKLDLLLDLSGPGKEKLLSDLSGTDALGRNVKFFRDPWFSGSARLVDGAELKWTFTDLIRARTTTHRSASGKTKTKTKHKVVRTLDIRLRVRSKDYAVDRKASAEPSGLRISIEESDKRSQIRVRFRTLPLAVGYPPTLREFVDAVAEAYRRLALHDPERKQP
jgi:hypothetical protein